MDLHQLYQANPIADATQTDDSNPTDYPSDHVVYTDAYGMPEDVDLPVAVNQGIFLPATAKDIGIPQYDPWTWAKPMQIQDYSVPEHGQYGPLEATDAKSGSIIAEWGGQPYPVRYFADMDYAVLQLPRRISVSSGESGRFFGPQQTAWEASTESIPPQDNYWSVLSGGGA